MADYRQVGEELWERFNPDSDQVWYYSALAEVFTDVDSPLAEELLASIGELKTSSQHGGVTRISAVLPPSVRVCPRGDGHHR